MHHAFPRPARGGGAGDVALSGAISAFSGALGAGVAMASGPATTVGAKFGKKALGYVTGLATAYGSAALTGGVNDENWDDILKSYSINFAANSVANGIADRAVEAASKRAGMGSNEDRKGNAELSGRAGGRRRHYKGTISQKMWNDQSARIQRVYNDVGNYLIDMKLGFVDRYIDPGTGKPVSDKFLDKMIQNYFGVTDLDLVGEAQFRAHASSEVRKSGLTGAQATSELNKWNNNTYGYSEVAYETDSFGVRQVRGGRINLRARAVIDMNDKELFDLIYHEVGHGPFHNIMRMNNGSANHGNVDGTAIPGWLTGDVFGDPSGVPNPPFYRPIWEQQSKP